MPTTPTTTLPASDHDDTYLARLDTTGAVTKDSRGRAAVHLYLIDPKGQAEVPVDAWVEQADLPTSKSPWFLAKHVKPYKTGGLYKLSPYSLSDKSPDKALSAYNSAGVRAYVKSQAALYSPGVDYKSLDRDLGKVKTKEPAAQAASDAAAAAKPKDSTPPPVREARVDEVAVGGPYVWTAPPMPHWAMYEFDQRVERGEDVPEILQGTSYLRIGTVAFREAVGPTDLQISESSQVAALPVMRQAESMKRVSGNIKKCVEFTLKFPNGPSIHQELIPFLRQTRRAPFVPVIHCELYDAGIEALAVESVQVTTDQNFPEVLECRVRAYQFNWRRYMLDADEFDLCFNYPLMDLWLAYPGEGADRLPYYSVGPAPSDTSLPWDSVLSASVPSRDWLAIVNDNAVSPDVQDERALFGGNSADGANNNLLYDAIRGLQSGDLSKVPVYGEGTDIKNSGALQVKGRPGLNPVIAKDASIKGAVQTVDVLGVTQYLAVRLSSPALMEAGFAPVTEGGADVVIYEPQGAPFQPETQVLADTRDTGARNGEWDLSGGNVIGDAVTPLIPGRAESKRSAKYAQLKADQASYEPGYWGLYKVDRKLPLPAVTDKAKTPDALDSPLGVAAQLTFLDPSRPVYVPVQTFEDLVITNVRMGMSNTLAEFSPEDEESPVFQHLGSSDVSLSVEGICPEETARALESFMREVSDLAVQFRGQWDGSAYGGYCRIDNELCKILGMQTAIPTSLCIDTIQGLPSERRVSLSLLSFDPTQRRINIPQDFGTTQDPEQAPAAGDTQAQYAYNSQAAHISQYVALDKHVRHIDLYPDIRPPSWEILHKWVVDLKNGSVWDYEKDEAKDGYEWLLYWNYPKDYWPGASADGKTKDVGYMKSLDLTDNPWTWGDFTPPDLTVIDLDGVTVPGARRSGFADPDFYCSHRGDSRRATGVEKIENAANSLLGTSTIPSTIMKTAHWGSDGVQGSTEWGSKDVGISGTAGSQKAAAVHAAVVFKGGDPTSGERNTKNIPEGGSPDNSHGQLAAQQAQSAIESAAPSPIYTAWGDGESPGVEYGGGYLPFIRAAAQKNAVPGVNMVSLIQSQIKHESFGKPTCATDAGNGQYAKGLLQLMPDTAKSLGVSNPLDPQQNINGGTAYIAGKLRKYHGDVQTALLAYTAGDGNVEKAKANPKAFPVSTDYVKKVYADYLRLAARKKDPDAQNPAANINSDAREKQVKDAIDTLAHGSANPFGSTDSTLRTIGFGLTGPILGAVLNGTDKSSAAVATLLDRNEPDAQYAAEQEAAREQDADIRTWDVDRATYDPVSGEDVFYAMRRTQMSGRLLQAFPTFLVLLSSGGPVFRVWRLFDVFYGLHSPMRITTFSSRKVAADTCTVSFADPYNSLSAQAADVQLAKENDTRRIIDLSDFMEGIESDLYPTFDLARRRSEELQALMIKPGNRLHVRLGFGSDAAQLPTVFNGTISGVRRQSDVVEVVALGDGVELTNPLSMNSSDQGSYVRTATGGGGETMRNIIMSFFTATGSDISNKLLGVVSAADNLLHEVQGGADFTKALQDSASLGYYLGANPYGIVHFGSLNQGATITDTSEVGVNVYSGWDKQPVNVTYASDDGPLGIVTGPTHLVLEDIPQAVVEGFHKLIGSYAGDGFAQQMDQCALWRHFNSEPLVGINLEKAAPWDVISQFRYVATDYIRQVEPFGLRSTLFFGKPYWPLHYQYDYPQVEALKRQQKQAIADTNGALGPVGRAVSAATPGFIKGDDLDNYISSKYGTTETGDSGINPLDNAEVVYRRRPYVQVHIAHSGANLIGCEVEATKEGWASIVQSLGTTCGLGSIGDDIESSFAQFLDINIYPEEQRMKMVQSGLYSSAEMRLANSGFSLLTEMPWMSTNVLNNHAVGVLHDEVRDMYQGNVVTTGNGWIRPFHLVHLDDEMKKLQGMVEVEAVTHSLTPDGGFVTVIKPDCLATAADPAAPTLWGHALALTGRILIGDAMLRAAASQTGRKLLRRALRHTLRLGQIADNLIARTVGQPLKFMEFYLSQTFRRRWRRTRAGRGVQTMLRRAADSDIPLIGGRKGLSQRREILDAFDEQLKLRASRVEKIGSRAGLLSTPFQRRVLGRKLDAKTVDEIKAKITEEEYEKALDILDLRAEKAPDAKPSIRKRVSLTEEQWKSVDGLPGVRDVEDPKLALRKQQLALHKRVEQHVGDILDKLRVKTDAQGNIEEEGLLDKLIHIADPYHGDGSVHGEIWQNLKDLRDKRKAIRWSNGVPRLESQITEDVLAGVAGSEGLEDGLLLLEDLANLRDRGSAEALRAALLGFPPGAEDLSKLDEAALRKLVGKRLKNAPTEEYLKILDERRKVIQKDLDKNLATKAAGKELKTLKAERHRIQTRLKSVELLRRRVLQAKGADVLQADAVARRVLQNEKIAKIVGDTFGTWGRKLPGSAETLDKAAAKIISGAGKANLKLGEQLDKAAPLARKLAGLAKDATLLTSAGRLARAAISIASGGMLTWLDRGMMSRHALFVAPLRSCGREFSAGINGHRGLVVGDSLGPVDSFIAYLCDDTKSPPLIGFLTSFIGLGGVHYYQDPGQYKETMEGLGIRTQETGDESAHRYQDHLEHLVALNALGFNLKLSDGMPAPGDAGGSVYTGPTTGVLATLNGKLGKAYSSVVMRLANSPSLSQTAGLVQPAGEASGFCARAIKEALTKGGVFQSYPGSRTARALGAFLASSPGTWERHGLTPFANVPDGAVCFWDNAHPPDGHVGFAWTDSQGRYILGNTNGQLKFRGVGREFRNVTSWYLPKTDV